MRYPVRYVISFSIIFSAANAHHRCCAVNLCSKQSRFYLYLWHHCQQWLTMVIMTIIDRTFEKWHHSQPWLTLVPFLKSAGQTAMVQPRVFRMLLASLSSLLVNCSLWHSISWLHAFHRVYQQSYC